MRQRLSPPPSDPVQERQQRRPTTGFLPAGRRATVVVFVLALGSFFLLLRLMGPIDLFGGRKEAGLFFVAIALPICGVLWLYDPIVGAIKKRKKAAGDSAYAYEDEPPRETKERRSRRELRALRWTSERRSTHPVSSWSATPYVYALVTLTLIFGVDALLTFAGLKPAYDAGSTFYVVVVVGSLAAMFGYERVINRLDQWFSTSP